MAEEKQVNAMFRRHEQLKRWEDSETNRESGSPKLKPRKVQFQDGCIFLAACSSGDREEVTRLLERGADINTANVDGLTALHQACIDDNLEMVEYLVEKEADVDVCDNEGWTPLHATASCGFTEIARYLIKMGANIAAVNNDGDLPIDICEDEEMEKLLQGELDKQGIDADEARKEEENRMLADANQWLNNRTVREKAHPKTGATALHVAAAKGYVSVLKVLLQANVDINAIDNDGWTSLHAAAHWSQYESVQVLVENYCDMDKKNIAGQSAMDVADEDMKKFLEEMKKKQALMKSREERNEDLIQNKGPPQKRRSSVTRMSGDQKQNVLHKTSEQERKALETNKIIKLDGDKQDSSGSEEEHTGTETERQNEINKPTSQTDKPQQTLERDRVPSDSEHMPIIDEETEKLSEKEKASKPEKISEPKKVTEKISEKDSEPQNNLETEKISEKDSEMVKNSKKEPESEKDKISEKDSEIDKISEKDAEIDKISEKDAEIDKISEKNAEIDKIPDKESEKDSGTEKISEKDEKKEKITEKDSEKEKISDKVSEKARRSEIGKHKELEVISENEVLSSVVEEQISNGETDDNNVDDDLPNSVKESSKSLKDSSNSTIKDTSKAPPPKELISRSISAPSSLPTEEEDLNISTNHKSRDNDYTSWRAGLRKTGSTSMVHERMNKENEEDKSLPRSASSPRLAYGQRIENDRNSRRNITASGSFSSGDKSDSKLTDRHSHTGVTSSSSTTSTSMDQNRSPYRSLSSYNSTGSYHSVYEPYYRRMNRRLDSHDDQDKFNSRTPSILSSVTSATAPVSTTTTSVSTSSSSTPTTNSVLRRSYEPPKRDEETETQRKARAKRARETRRSTQGVSLEDIEKAEETLRNSTTDKDRMAALQAKADATKADSSATSESSKEPSAARDSVRDSVSNRTSLSTSKDTSSDDSSSYRRRNVEDRQDEDSRSSFRRSRDPNRDISSSQYSSDNSTSSYVPRSQRAALSSTDPTSTSTSLPGGSALSRTSSYRSRLRNGDITSREEEKAKEDPKKDETDHEEKKESSALQKRRARRERRSTGIVNYTPEDEEDEKGKEGSKPEDEEKKEEKKEESLGSRYGTSRYSSTSDVTPSDRYRDRPSSYSEYSRSTPSSLDTDYKKLYEEEKVENDKLRKELEQTKRELREAKTELDRAMRKHTESSRTESQDKREKRALERKVSEMEEELKKMDSLKNDNLRLREENGALIRVISKLSK